MFTVYNYQMINRFYLLVILVILRLNGYAQITEKIMEETQIKVKHAYELCRHLHQRGILFGIPDDLVAYPQMHLRKCRA